MKSGELLLHLEAYLRCRERWDFLLVRAKGCYATSWPSSKTTASEEQSVPKSLLIGLVRPLTVAGSVEKRRA